MTQHAHHAARYSAVVALAGALLAPGVTTPATALEDPGQTPDATPAQAGNNAQAQDPAVKVPGEGNERMPQSKVEQPAAKANDTATVAGSTVIKNGQGLEISGSGWGANTVIAVKYDSGEVKPTDPVTHNGKDLSARGVVAVIKADENGNFTETIPFPTNANWAVGSEHEINFLSGSLQDGDQKHSATHKVTVGEEAPVAETPKAEETPKAQTPEEQPQVQETPKNETPVEAPKAEETPAQQPQTDDAAKNETPADTPKVEETPKAEETPVQPKADDAAKNEAEQQPKAEEKPAPQPAENTPAPAAFENSQTVKSNGVTVTGVKYAKNGQEIEVSGTGWKNADGTGSVIAVKYDGGEVKPTNPVTYDGKDWAGRGVVAVVTANPDGTFTAKLPFPNAENSTGFEKWMDGSQHEITFLSGTLQKGNAAKHSVTLNVTIGDASATAKDPKDNGQQSTNGDKKLEPQPTEPSAQDYQNDGNTGAQPSPADNQGGTVKQGPQNNAPAPTAPAPVVETQTVSDGKATVTGPKTVNHGQGIVVNGSGWSPYSVIAVKYDSGDIKLDRAVVYNGKDYAARGVVAIIQADADGKFTYTLPFPNSDKWGVGTVHDITFLSGSLQNGDEQHSVTLSVKIAGSGGYDAGLGNNGSGYGSVAPIPTQSSGINFTARQGSITKQASLGAAAELENDTLINRVQARAKAAAKNGSNSGAQAKSAPKKTHTAKAVPGKNGTQGNATTAATQSDSNSAPNIIGAELSGFSRWFANNANNVLLSIAGLIILVLALTFRKRA
ncbi:hypothetical protein [Rothia sp. HMSC036D11]|uniref:hypothetical protein n=1 Tax=Rothia sp. HMSC036D11 TaxID=1739462 RepID=UPI0008A52700|nr:hypothetical protein [Rothia sp. HMSC036D11]OFQ07810.1 hypothetical protein HMPREF2958_05485 [Rothia sp. HMSC036D11]